MRGPLEAWLTCNCLNIRRTFGAWRLTSELVPFNGTRTPADHGACAAGPATQLRVHNRVTTAHTPDNRHPRVMHTGPSLPRILTGGLPEWEGRERSPGVIKRAKEPTMPTSANKTLANAHVQ